MSFGDNTIPMIIHQNDILGMVLAGGKNRRMGDEPKWQLPLANKPIIEHILERFNPQLSTIIVNGSDSALKNYHHTIVPDSFIANNEPQGPLAGILAGLEYAQAHGYHWLISCPCDSPFLPLNYVQKLVQAINHTHQHACIAASLGRIHPVFGLWSTALIPALTDTLQHSDLRAIGYWAKHLHPSATIVNFHQSASSTIDAFMNINTPDEWQHADALYTHSQKTTS